MSANATRNRRNPNRRPVPSLKDLDDRDFHEAYDGDETYRDGRSELHDEEIGDLLRVVTLATGEKPSGPLS